MRVRRAGGPVGEVALRPGPVHNRRPCL